MFITVCEIYSEPNINKNKLKLNTVAWVRERTIPTK
jgi:hypothetical protein